MEIYDVINYTIFRDDSTDPITYEFKLMGAVIRNIPTLPYVTKSGAIKVTVLNRSET